MKDETQELIALIAEYKAAVKKAVAYLNAKSEKDKGFQVQQESPGHYAGYLDELRRIRYAFHGAGCYVTTDEFKVDFDFGGEARCDGIDTWFLFDFLRSNATVKAKYPLLTSGEQLEQLLQKLEEDQLVMRGVEGSHEWTYYLVTDVHDPNPPKWKAYPPADGIYW